MKIRDFVIKHFDTIETIALLAFAAGLMTVMFEIDNANYFFGAGAVIMSAPYWFKASEKNKNSQIRTNIKHKVIWYGLMITPIAIFSKVRMDERSNLFMGVAVGILIIAFFINLTNKIAKKEDVPSSNFIRIIAAIIIALSIFALPLPNIN
ncbi:MAG: hypothetical protein JXR68_00245 [Bacteroidales bacterium]|nr:hypothetical protein [Bacteroidales bacterium]